MALVSTVQYIIYYHNVFVIKYEFTVMKPKNEIKKDALIKSESKKPTNRLDNISQVIENKPHSYILMQVLEL